MIDGSSTRPKLAMVTRANILGHPRRRIFQDTHDIQELECDLKAMVITFRPRVSDRAVGRVGSVDKTVPLSIQPVLSSSRVNP
jgi:hypothetical protein